jgi:AraC-like DNA-binding protein
MAPSSIREWARFRAAPIDGVTRFDARFVEHVFERHSHDTFSIGVTQGGVQRFDCRGARHDSVAGDLVLFNPDEPHNGRAGGDDGFRYTMLYVPQATLDALLVDGGEREPACHWRQPHVRDPLLGADLVRAAASIDQAGETLRAQALLADALRRIGQRHGVGARTGTTPTLASRRWDTLREFMHAHCSEDLRTEQLAVVCGLTRAHLTRAFARRFGLPPHAYLNALRLRGVQRALLDGCSIADAASRMGFADQSHLTRRFKGTFGLTPRRWLEQMQR